MLTVTADCTILYQSRTEEQSYEFMKFDSENIKISVKSKSIDEVVTDSLLVRIESGLIISKNK